MAVNTTLDADVFAALEARLETMPGGYEIVYQGDTYPTEADTAFIIAQDVRDAPTSPFQGENTQNENTGNFSLSVMVPTTYKHYHALAIIGYIRAHFPKGAKYTYDDATVTIMQDPSYVGNAYRDGSFNRYPVDVKWRCAG